MVKDTPLYFVETQPIHAQDLWTESAEESGAHVLTASRKTCGHTVAGRDCCLISNLPVQVKSIKVDQVIQTYAFFDPGSSATFCSEQLMRRLNLTGRQT